MGRWIDRLIVTVLAAAIIYVVFISAFGNILAACCMTFFCCALLFKPQRSKHRRMTRLQAQTILQNWAYDDDESAQKQIETLISDRRGTLIYLPKHPTATLSMGDVFSSWKKHRNEAKLLVAAACHSDGRARTFAASLQSPSVEIIDAAVLIPLIRRSTIPPPKVLRGRQLLIRLKQLVVELPSRRPWHHNLLFGLGFMLIYMITGSAAYLALSVSALFIAGIGVRMHT